MGSKPTSSSKTRPMYQTGYNNYKIMSFGKAVGWAATSAVSGVMLVSFGLKATALAAAVVSSVFFFAFIFVLERPGERRLPWSSGESASAHREGKPFNTSAKTPMPQRRWVS